MSDLVLPGLIDAHVHLREPGATHKEDITSGTVAALAGGVVAVLDMPNNIPPIVDSHSFHSKLDLFRTKAVSDYGLFVGFDGRNIQALVDVAPQAVGLKLYLDETFGDMTTREPVMLAQVFEAWPGPGPIAVHADSHSIPVALALASRYGRRVHICHVPHPDDLVVIDAARQHGVQATCEVTPHHLFLADDSIACLGPYALMKPPLVSPVAVALYWERLPMVDIIGTDHAPHTCSEKESSSPPPGVPGLETALPLLLYAVEQGCLSLSRLVELMHRNPLRIYNLSAPPDTAVEVALERPYRLSFDGYRTRCGWSPFVGQWALGRVRRVRLRGRVVYEEGRLLAEPGYGRGLARLH